MSRDLTDALSKLFIKLGGKLSDSKENKGPVDYIDDITGIVEPGGGDNNFIVTFVYDEDTGTYSVDKTFNDAKKAITDGKNIIFNIYGANYPAYSSFDMDDNQMLYTDIFLLRTYSDESHYTFTHLEWNELDAISEKLGEFPVTVDT